MFGGGMSSGMKGLENQLLCAPAPAHARRARRADRVCCLQPRSQLKFTSKQLGRLSKKCEKEEKAEKEKIKKCLEKDNHDGAPLSATSLFFLPPA